MAFDAVLKQARAAQVIKLSAINVSDCQFCLLHMFCAVFDGINDCLGHVMSLVCHTKHRLSLLCEGSL